MVKVKQGILNGTLREVYLVAQKGSERKQRDVRKTVRMSEGFKKSKHVNNSRQRSISLYSSEFKRGRKLIKNIT